ncbi:hypothetical protein BURKHO8Y_110234 [Burkholderia sp. 8Y]|nr:hypothetical protein BURKHO8Y_110234 [Burkholderia sp. 8Y]
MRKSDAHRARRRMVGMYGLRERMEGSMTFDEWDRKTMADSRESPNAYARRAFNAGVRSGQASPAAPSSDAPSSDAPPLGYVNAEMDRPPHRRGDPVPGRAPYVRDNAGICCAVERCAGRGAVSVDCNTARLERHQAHVLEFDGQRRRAVQG